MNKNSIKEDIKLLMEMKNNCLNRFEYYTDPKAREKAEAIEHILSDYKRVLEINEVLLKENEELKADNYELNNRINDLLDNIPVQRVKDKIRHYQELQDNYIKKYDEINEGLQAMINVLQELIEEREGK